MLNEIVIPMVSLGGIGLVASLGLGVASRFFAVEVDPRVETLEDILPGANCGGCGLPGCSQFAGALVTGSVEVGACTAISEDAAGAVGELLGVEVELGEKMVARVLCAGSRDKAKERFLYKGVETCQGAVLLCQGSKGCLYGCLGLGSCVTVCPFDAIHMAPNGLPVVDKGRCTGCGKCIDACPKDVIGLVPVSHEVIVLCKSRDKGKVVRKLCDVGCMGCKLCAKNCSYDAVIIEDNVSRIDPVKCKQCGMCAAKCPRKIIIDEAPPRGIAVIGEVCDGCAECVPACKLKAISGEEAQLHAINSDKCIGCGVCLEKCPQTAIKLIETPQKPSLESQAAAG